MYCSVTKSHVFLVCVHFVNEVRLCSHENRLMHVKREGQERRSDSMQTSKFEEQVQLLVARNSVLLYIVKCEITHKDPFLLTVQVQMKTR